LKEFRDKVATASFLRVRFLVARGVTRTIPIVHVILLIECHLLYARVYTRSSDIGHSRSRFLATRGPSVSYAT